MSNTYRPRRVLAVFAALALPAVTCGVAPALRDLILRTQRLEEFVANAQLPPVLVDDRGLVVGPVLEYNDLMLYTSVAYWQASPYLGKTYAWTNQGPSKALATVLYEVPGQSPVALEANRDALLTPVRGTSEEYYFESPDCSGTAWIWATQLGTSVFGHGRIGPPGQTLYAVDLDALDERVSVRSRLVAFSGSGGGGRPDELNPCVSDGRTLGHMLPLHPVADLSTFTPPFQLMDQRELLR